MTIHEHSVLITGGTGQVGWGAARAATAAGAHLILPTRSEHGAAELRNEFPTADVVVADVGADSGAALVEAAITRAGRLDHVVAPLGAWWQHGPSIDEQPAELDDLLATYASAQFRLLRTTVPHLRLASGSYTLVTGAAGEMLLPGTGLLVVAVRAQYALAEVLRQELADDPIRFNELRIAARIERTPRPGVIPSETLGAAFVDIMTSDNRSELIRYPATSHP